MKSHKALIAKIEKYQQWMEDIRECNDLLVKTVCTLLFYEKYIN